MNYALFGKICKNPLTQIKTKIITDEHEILKSAFKPTLKYLFKKDIFEYRGTALIEFYKRDIKNDKPICLDATVLETTYVRYILLFSAIIHSKSYSYII